MFCFSMYLFGFFFAAADAAIAVRSGCGISGRLLLIVPIKNESASSRQGGLGGEGEEGEGRWNSTSRGNC